MPWQGLMYLRLYHIWHLVCCRTPYVSKCLCFMHPVIFSSFCFLVRPCFVLQELNQRDLEGELQGLFVSFKRTVFQICCLMLSAPNESQSAAELHKPHCVKRLTSKSRSHLHSSPAHVYCSSHMGAGGRKTNSVFCIMELLCICNIQNKKSVPGPVAREINLTTVFFMGVKRGNR